MNKYRNKKTLCHQGHYHDSKKEAAYCNELALRLKAGDIIDFETQKVYQLQPGFKNSLGAKIRPITYTPDFVVYHDGCIEIVDVKGGRGTQTQLWKVKWKILQYQMREKGLYKFTIV